MSTPDPLVSIVIPAFNSRTWVTEAVDSALAQSYGHCEVIIVDDGSTDDTYALLQERYADTVRCIRQGNLGLSAARNTGLAHAAGMYVQFLDADDVLLPNKVAVHVDALQSLPGYTVAYCDFWFVDGDARARAPSGFTDRFASGDVLAALIDDNFIVVHAALARTADVRAAGGFDESLHACEDYDLWLRLAARGCRFLHTAEPLVLYRRTASSMSTDVFRQITGTIRVIEKLARYRDLELPLQQLRRTRIARLHRHLTRAMVTEAVALAKQGRFGAAVIRLGRAAASAVPGRAVGTARNLRARLDPLAAKRAGELDYWRGVAAARGVLDAWHYEWFYTTHFGFDTETFRDRRILDIGCGPRGSLEWADMARERVGLDPLALEYRSVGTRTHAMQYVAATSHAVPFPTAYFDIVTSFNSLDHVDDLPSTVSEIARVLKPGGTLLLLVEVNQPATVVEPITLRWDTPDLFAPALEPVVVRRYEMDPRGLYAGIREGIPFNETDPSPRSGILSCSFRRQA